MTSISSLASPMSASALSAGVDKNVRPLLDLIDDMRSLGIEAYLPLPQIAVMGDQSSGKSSVLEALSGVPFPRGTGLVTRCPCQLTMKRTTESGWKGKIGVLKAGDVDSPEAAKLAGSVRSVSELTAAIERVTSALTAGSATAFSSDSIVVSVSAPDVPDLTLVDLPGIVRTVTAGQDAGVIAEVNAMIDRYLSQDRTIVLAIVPANQDVATVDILERALSVDPTGERTVGVLTKPDLVGEGAEDEVVAVLKNERKPLRLGYVMVKNRSAAELKQGRRLGDKDAERRYFGEHPVWRQLPKELLGVDMLTSRLTNLLTKRIEKVLPELKWELQELFTSAEAGCDRLGAPPPTAPLERAKLVLRCFAEYCTLLRHSARGDYREALLSQNVELRLRSQADGIFRRLEEAIADQKPDFDDQDFTHKLHRELKALRGRELPGLLNSYFFYGFMARHVEMWRPLIEGAKQALYDVGYSTAARLADDLFPAYPRLAAQVRDVLAAYLDASALELDTKVEEVFKHESDPFISRNELADAILKVRFERFEKALDAVMVNCGSGPAEAKKQAVQERAADAQQRNRLAESHSDAAREQGQPVNDPRLNPPDPRAQARRGSQQQQGAAVPPVQQPVPNQQQQPPVSHQQQHHQQQQQQMQRGGPPHNRSSQPTPAQVQAQSRRDDTVVSKEDDDRRRKMAELKDHPLKEVVLTSLGRWYMANHGVTSMSMVEDMRTVLIAYWGVAAKRITENICALFETNVLAVFAEDVEKRLLSVARSDDPEAVDALLAQDDDIKRQREALKKQKDRVAAALNSIHRFAPNVVARPPEDKKNPDHVAPAAPATQDLGGFPGTSGPGTSLTHKAGVPTRDGGVPSQTAARPTTRAVVGASIKNSANKALIETFGFTSNGDNGGFVYWLGTSGKRERFSNPHDKGRLRVTSSGLAAGSESLLVARKRLPCWTNDVPDAWICLDLGRNRALAPTHYTLCNGSPDPGFDLLAWALEGYDPDQDIWIDLNLPVHTKAGLPSPWGVHTFPLDHKNTAWRYLRIRHTGLNSRGTRELPVCAWEFYGDLYSVQS